MDSARWQRIQDLFHQAADLPKHEQGPFLNANCGGDATLAADVLALLEEDARGFALLDGGVANAAERVFDQQAVPAFPEFGPYKIKSILGEGGMGVVYLAERADLGSMVAIKVLRDAWLSPARRERFATEQRLLAQLNHPLIARLYDAGALADGTPWFVMEYVDGIPLNVDSREHRYSIRQRLELVRSVCEAVEYAHQNAVIHRDLKPSNIFVKRDGTVRLLDFGIAKPIESLDAANPTRTGQRMMTPAYAAPEQIRGEQVGVQADVYSLGVILYELMTGERPFDLSNLSPGEAETKILREEPQKPSAVVRNTAGAAVSSAPALSRSAWADLDVLCLTAMRKDPQRRYRSVEALSRDITHYLKGEPLEARPDSLRYRAGKFVGRNRRAVAATALVFTLVVGLVIFYTARLSKARNLAVAEAARTERIQHFMLNLFEGGDQAAGPADSLRVVTLLNRGLAEVRSLDTAPKAQADLYATMGDIYEKLGKLDQADSLLENALARRKSVFGADSPEVAESMVALALLRAHQAQYAEAERLAREGLAMTERHRTPNDPAVARATAVLGQVLEDRGSYEQAIPLLESAAKLQSLPGAPQADLASSLSELANCHFYLGHYLIAESSNQQALTIERRLYGQQHPLVADTLLNLAAIEYQWGNFTSDERDSREALEIYKSWYGADHPETGDTMTILAQSLIPQKRYDEAVSLLEQSLVIQEHAYGPVHPRVAFALNELGNALLRQGKLDRAQASFTRELQIYESVYGENNYQVGLARSNLAGVYAKHKEYAQAERLFREALACYAKTLPPDHLNVGITRIRLGGALAGQHRYEEAKAESLAGYDILINKTKSSLSWLQVARQDLAEEYSALNQPVQAAHFREELAKNGGNVPSFAARN